MIRLAYARLGQRDAPALLIDQHQPIGHALDLQRQRRAPALTQPANLSEIGGVGALPGQGQRSRQVKVEVFRAKQHLAAVGGVDRTGRCVAVELAGYDLGGAFGAASGFFWGGIVEGCFGFIALRSFWRMRWRGGLSFRDFGVVAGLA